MSVSHRDDTTRHDTTVTREHRLDQTSPLACLSAVLTEER